MTTPTTSPDSPEQAPPRRRLGRKLLLSLGVALVTLGAAEGMLHLLGVEGRPGRLERDPLLGWRNKAGWRGPVFSVNSLGFLGEELASRKPEGAVRVFCLGDSCTAGDLLPDFGETYPRQLERLLAERYPGRRVEVVNAGVGGYSSFQGRLWLEREILGYEPDAVVVYFGWNDHWPARGGGSDAEVSGSWGERARAWLSWSRLLHLAIRVWHVVATRQQVVTGDEEAQVTIPPMDGPRRVPLEAYEANLRAVVDALRGRGGQAVIVTAPNYLATTDARARQWSDPDAVATLVEVHAGYNEAARRVARETGAGLVDAEKDFAEAARPARLFFKPPDDYIHLSAEGCGRLAERVAACPAIERLFEERDADE